VSTLESPRLSPLAIAGLGACAFLVTLPLGNRAIAYGAVAFLVGCIFALRDTTAPVITWVHAITLLVFIVWLIPIKSYRLPVNLPFNLEVYRLLVLLLMFGWVGSALLGKVRFEAGGVGKPLLLLAGGAVASQVVNFGDIDSAGAGTQAIKSLSFFISFLIVFALVYSSIQTLIDINRVLEALVIGGTIVAITALYEARTRYNLFTHLDDWIPALQQVRERGESVRGSKLRAFASAQHPIALGSALALTAPFAIYLARQARTRLGLAFWVSASAVLIAGAFATVSRTIVVMLVPMVLVALWLRRREAMRFWPLLFLLPVAVHFLAPGTLGTLQKNLKPEKVVTEQQGYAGPRASGRLNDVGPGLELWRIAPFLGHALGTQPTTGTVASPTSGTLQAPVEETSSPDRIIFDDEYLGTLVSLGIVGFIGIVWLVWGTAFKCGIAAKKVGGQAGGVLVASSAACLGFALGMATYDAFSFVQASLFFFVIAALGLRARALTMATGA
jgi:O-antigen ligase/polysaccharide polymerase Wzy-like membrane protein